MYNYDIRNQIRTESKSKLFGEVCVMALVVAIILCILYGAQVDNPFRIHSPKTDEEISNLFKNGDVYISIDFADLDYTGYYKEDENKDIIYYCYKFRLDKLDYFVFVPPNHIKTEFEYSKEQLMDYSFEGRLRKDKSLLELTAKDYNLNVKDFMEEYKVSPIIIDVARNNRRQMLLAWSLFITLFIIYVIYIIYSIKRTKDVWSCREVRKLGKKEEIEPILNEMNREVSKNVLFNTNKFKITKKWFLAFYDGNVILALRSKIQSVKGVEKVKKSYGIAKIGLRLFVEIVLENGKTYKIPIEEQKDYDEILKIMTNKVNLSGRKKKK